MSDDYRDYLEGIYDIDLDKATSMESILQGSGQRVADVVKAMNISEEVKREQEEAKVREARRILNKDEKDAITKEEIDRVFENYGQSDTFGEYLVDGAVLTCSQASLEDFKMDGKTIPLEKKEQETSEQFQGRKQTVLRVSENPISANGLTYATVRDTVKDGNIIPFRCHCKIEADREIERERIRKDPDCSKHGVCRHLMRLNLEWENYPMDSPYLNLDEIDRQEPVSDSYLQAVRHGAIKDVNLVSKKAGITMTSILFCKHGGIITPVTSGQTDKNEIYMTVTGAVWIADEGLNPQGIPLYSGKTMNGKSEYFSLKDFSEAEYANVALTREAASGERANYKYIHPIATQVEGLPESFNEGYHKSFLSNGIEVSTADNRIEIACRWGISTCDGEVWADSLAGKYIDIVLSDGTVLACIMGGSKGNEGNSDSVGVVHDDGSIFEFLTLAVSDKGKNVAKTDILHGCDMVGVYVYSEKRLYNTETGEYTYYFSESIDE